MDLNYFIISPLSSLLFSFLIFGAPRGELEEEGGGWGGGKGEKGRESRKKGRKEEKKEKVLFAIIWNVTSLGKYLCHSLFSGSCMHTDSSVVVLID